MTGSTSTFEKLLRELFEEFLIGALSCEVDHWEATEKFTQQLDALCGHSQNWPYELKQRWGKINGSPLPSMEKSE